MKEETPYINLRAFSYEPKTSYKTSEIETPYINLRAFSYEPNTSFNTSEKKPS